MFTRRNALTGLEKIEYLQSQENAEIYRLAFHLIDAYFTDEDDANEAAAAAGAGNQANEPPANQQFNF